jgi:hypothetical protein
MFTDQKADEKALSGELQHLFRSTYINVVSGVGYFNIDSEERVKIGLSLPPDILPIDQFTTDRDVRHTNLYIYSYTRLPKNLTLTIGGVAISSTAILQEPRIKSNSTLSSGLPGIHLPLPLFGGLFSGR